MNVGIIGYGSMGKMLADKFAASGILDLEYVFVTNRSKEKLLPSELRYAKIIGNLLKGRILYLSV